MPSEIEAKRKVHVRAFADGSFADDQLFVISELPLTLHLNGREVVTLLFNGQHPRELALGFLFSEGFLESADEIQTVLWDDETGLCEVTLDKPTDQFEKIFGKRIVTSGCGKGSSFYHVMDQIAAGQVNITSQRTVTPDTICRLSGDMYSASPLYRDTHGVHGAALADDRELLYYREDIGRHNALDKIAGTCIVAGVNPEDKLLFTTGRLTSEVIIKAGRLGTPIVVSRSSATAMALELAEKMGITVIGGARKGKFHVYTGQERVQFTRSE